MNGKKTNWIGKIGTLALIGALALGTVSTFAQQAPQAQTGDKAAATHAKKAPRASKATLPQGTKFSVNSATAAELDRLPRVGPKLAQRIVDYRTAHKGFKSLDELRNVKGCGAKVLEGMKPYLSL